MIYSYDHRPPHVHVIGPGAEARIALGHEGERPWVMRPAGMWSKLLRRLSGIAIS